MASLANKNRRLQRRSSIKPNTKTYGLKNSEITAANNKCAFYCVPCKKDVSCGHQGKADVEPHCTSTIHKNMASAIKDKRIISNLFPSSSGSGNPLHCST